MSTFTSVVHTGESKSLWNHTLSPGWTEEEQRVLYLCLQKYGIGNYKKILSNMHLPEKTMAQINNQTQRFLGQQATKEFHLMKVDLEAVNRWNASKTGPDIHRKNGCIINSGNKLEREDVRKLQVAHQQNFGLSEIYQKHIVIPTVTGENTKHLMVEGEDLAEGWLSFRQQKLKRLASMDVAVERLKRQLTDFGASFNEVPDKDLPILAESNLQKTNTADLATSDETTDKAHSTSESQSNSKKKAADMSSPVHKRTRKTEKTQEQLDAELAMKLQAEEGWGY